MRIKTNLKVREVAGEHIVMRLGDGEKADMTTVISFNESALLLVERLRGRDFTADDVAAVLTEEYDVDNETAMRDAAQWIDMMVKNRLIEQ